MTLLYIHFGVKHRNKKGFVTHIGSTSTQVFNLVLYEYAPKTKWKLMAKYFANFVRSKDIHFFAWEQIG